MKPVHHLSDETLMSHAAGTLDASISAVTACHLEYCAECRSRLRDMDVIGSILMEQMPCAELSGTALQSAWKKAAQAQRDIRLDGHARHALKSKHGELPATLAAYTGLDLRSVPWKWLAPGIKHYKIRLPEGAKGDLRLLKIKPGQKLPEHGHGGTELTLIIQGAYDDCVGRFQPGDVADLDEEIEHQPVADAKDGCICLAATVRPARFKGRISKILQPLIGM